MAVSGWHFCSERAYPSALLRSCTCTRVSWEWRLVVLCVAVPSRHKNSVGCCRHTHAQPTKLRCVGVHDAMGTSRLGQQALVWPRQNLPAQPVRIRQPVSPHPCWLPFTPHPHPHPRTPDHHPTSTSGHRVQGSFRSATVRTSGIGTTVIASNTTAQVTANLAGITTLVVDVPQGESSAPVLTAEPGMKFQHAVITPYPAAAL